jgi:hypothetical protein
MRLSKRAIIYYVMPALALSVIFVPAMARALLYYGPSLRFFVGIAISLATLIAVSIPAALVSERIWGRLLRPRSGNETETAGVPPPRFAKPRPVAANSSLARNRHEPGCDGRHSQRKRCTPPRTGA